MTKKLVTYFSATGTTADVAAEVAKVAGADLCEIAAEVPYTQADLNFRDSGARSKVEMDDRSSRPAIAPCDVDVSAYDVVFVGYPLWWGSAPTIVNTFIESYDFTGKTIVPFATAGSGAFGNSADGLKASAPGATFLEGAVLRGQRAVPDIAAWVEGLGL